jgi:hypothetical protein
LKEMWRRRRLKPGGVVRLPPLRRKKTNHYFLIGWPTLPEPEVEAPPKLLELPASEWKEAAILVLQRNVRCKFRAATMIQSRWRAIEGRRRAVAVWRRRDSLAAARLTAVARGLKARRLARRLIREAVEC